MCTQMFLFVSQSIIHVIGVTESKENLHVGLLGLNNLKCISYRNAHTNRGITKAYIQDCIFTYLHREYCCLFHYTQLFFTSYLILSPSLSKILGLPICHVTCHNFSSRAVKGLIHWRIIS